MAPLIYLFILVFLFIYDVVKTTQNQLQEKKKFQSNERILHIYTQNTA